jgi:hypothetical protein
MIENEFWSVGRPTARDARRTLDDDAGRVGTAANPGIARVALTHGARRGADFVLSGVLDQLEMQSEFVDAGAVAGLDTRAVLKIVRHELRLARRRVRAMRSS